MIIYFYVLYKVFVIVKTVIVEFFVNKVSICYYYMAR